MKKYYIPRQQTEMTIRSNLSQEVQEYISNTDPLEIRERVNGIIEVDESGYIQEFDNWGEVERHFLSIVEEMEEIKNET